MKTIEEVKELLKGRLAKYKNNPPSFPSEYESGWQDGSENELEELLFLLEKEEKPVTSWDSNDVPEMVRELCYMAHKFALKVGEANKSYPVSWESYGNSGCESVTRGENFHIFRSGYHIDNYRLTGFIGDVEVAYTKMKEIFEKKE